jgi:ribosomal protein L37AE/L43A
MSEKTYVCPKCGLEVQVEEGEPVPECSHCHVAMEPLPYCTSVPHAEMDRLEDPDEPCADGTTPKKYKK